MILTASPPADNVLAAYRPIVYIVTGTGNPVVYLDIYFDGVYYKSLSMTAPSALFGGTQLYFFDIQTAAQEYLKSYTCPIDTVGVQLQSATGSGMYMVNVACKVRGSTTTSGLVVIDGPAPIQGTVQSDPVSGGGYPFGYNWIVNSALQFEDAPIYLDALDIGTYFTRNPDFFIYGLSHARYYNESIEDFGHTGIFTGPNVIYHDTVAHVDYYSTPFKLFLETPAGVEYQLGSTFTMQANAVYYVPTSPASLMLMAGSSAVPWSTLEYYRIMLKGGDGSTPQIFIGAWQSQRHYLDHKKCEHKRIRFINTLGAIDSINLCENNETLVVSSDVWSRNSLDNSLSTITHRQNRINTNSNEKISSTGYFKEEEIEQLKELQTSQMAWLEIRRAQTKGDPDLLAIRILDTETVTLKYDDRYEYAFTIVYQPSTPNIHLRS